MAIYRNVVEFGHVSGLPEDTIVNVFHTFGPANITSAQFDEIGDEVVDFFCEAQAGATVANPLATYMSGVLSRDADLCHVWQYLVPAVPGPLGSPIHHGTFTLPINAGNEKNLPSELAIVASFSANVTNILEEGAGNTRPRARRRGRMFLGPWTAGALSGAAGDETVPRPHANVRSIIQKAMDNFEAGIRATGHSSWQVFSEADWTGRDVVSGFVDDAFDIQRRRGEQAISRLTWAN